MAEIDTPPRPSLLFPRDREMVGLRPVLCNTRLLVLPDQLGRALLECGDTSLGVRHVPLSTRLEWFSFRYALQ